MSKFLVTASVLLLSLSAVFGVLNTSRSHALRAEVMRNETARQDAERRLSQRERQSKIRPATVSAPATNVSPTDQASLANAEAELVKSQSEKQDLEAKLRASEAQIDELKKRGAMPTEPTVVAGSPPAPSTEELQTQLSDARKQLDASEREKSFISEKIRVAQEHSNQLEVEKKRRVITTGHPGVRATVLAVNQAYNFVVLNLGGRHGIEPNSEMLVVRGGVLIGKIRISSVEPATSIGDILTSSLARGVQVQPGDIVIYAGSNS